MRPTHLLSALACLTAITQGAAYADDLCATPRETALIQDYAYDQRPGIPVSIGARNLEIPEAVFSSGIKEGDVVGVMATPDIATEIWTNMDEAWGPEAKVGLVFSPSNQHAFAMPHLLPVQVDGSEDGYLDVYADDGAGVHSHIQLKYVEAIYATDLKNADGVSETKGISLYGPDGNLIIGVYASIKGDVYSEAAEAGFATTWDLIASMPQACE